jgi:hypothetical protein
MPQFTVYLGTRAADLLKTAPFSSWAFSQTIDEDLAELRVNYDCESEGLSIVCDFEDRITTIFLTSVRLAYEELNLPLHSGRSDVPTAFGKPSRSGQPSVNTILGEYGAWDRYDLVDHSLHVEYRPKLDRVKMVTLMLRNVAP